MNSGNGTMNFPNNFGALWFFPMMILSIQLQLLTYEQLPLHCLFSYLEFIAAIQKSDKYWNDLRSLRIYFSIFCFYYIFCFNLLPFNSYKNDANQRWMKKSGIIFQCLHGEILCKRWRWKLIKNMEGFLFFEMVDHIPDVSTMFQH